MNCADQPGILGPRSRVCLDGITILLRGPPTDRLPTPCFVPAIPACADQHMKWWCLGTAPPPGLPLPPRGAVTYPAAEKEDISGSASARLQAVP